jgi:hypothetical protein
VAQLSLIQFIKSNPKSFPHFIVLVCEAGAGAGPKEIEKISKNIEKGWEKIKKGWKNIEKDGKKIKKMEKIEKRF